MLTLGGRTKKVGKEQKDKITPKKVERGKNAEIAGIGSRS